MVQRAVPVAVDVAVEDGAAESAEDVAPRAHRGGAPADAAGDTRVVLNALVHRHHDGVPWATATITEHSRLLAISQDATAAADAAALKEGGEPGTVAAKSLIAAACVQCIAV